MEKVAPMVPDGNFILMDGSGYLDGVGLLFPHGLALASEGTTRRNGIAIIFCFISFSKGNGIPSKPGLCRYGNRFGLRFSLLNSDHNLCAAKEK